GGAVDRRSEYAVLELDVCADDRSGKVLRHPLQRLQHQRQVYVAVLHDHLERSKQLRCHQLEVLAAEGVKWYLHGRWFYRAIALWDGMIFQGIAAEEEP